MAHLASLSFLFIGASHQSKSLKQFRLTDDALVKDLFYPTATSPSHKMSSCRAERKTPLGIRTRKVSSLKDLQAKMKLGQDQASIPCLIQVLWCLNAFNLYAPVRLIYLPDQSAPRTPMFSDHRPAVKAFRHLRVEGRC